MCMQASCHSGLPLVSIHSHIHIYKLAADRYVHVFVFGYRYASIRAIETKSRTDDQQWLTYWVLYSLITLFEITFAKVLEWWVHSLPYICAHICMCILNTCTKNVMLWWIDISCFQLIRSFPIWAYGKLILTCWLVLPQFNGAAYVYRRFIRPFYINPQSSAQQIWYFPRSKDKKNMFSKPDDVLTAAEKYMEEHGTEAFERLITKVCT